MTTTTSPTFTHPNADAILAACRDAGLRAADIALTDSPTVVVVFEPGDDTRYELAITRPGVPVLDWYGSSTPWWIVADLINDRCAVWFGNSVRYDYAARLWGDGNTHTGHVIAAVLNTIAEQRS